MKNADVEAPTASIEWPPLRHISAGATLVVGPIDHCQAPLLPVERKLETDITQARLREVRAGRAVARSGLRHWGAQSAPVLMDSITGAPIWPKGYCGSLSHTSQYVAAVVALSTHYDAVGVDIDDKRPLGAAVSDIATKAELQLLSRVVASQMASAECLAFCIKEAIFKCQWPLTNDLVLDFLDIRIMQDKKDGSLGFCVTDRERTFLAQIAPRVEIKILEIQGVSVVCALLPKQ